VIRREETNAVRVVINVVGKKRKRKTKKEKKYG
jgi:hypothetical protein